MYSNITDAWNNDPVKEISTKLSQGSFRDTSEYSESFDFKKHANKSNNKRIKYPEVTLTDTEPLPYNVHYNRCHECKKHIYDIINKKIKKSIQEALNESKQTKETKDPYISDSSKEILIIVLCNVVLLLLIVLLFRSFT